MKNNGLAYAGLILSAAIALFLNFKLVQLLERLVDLPSWSQPAWRMHYFLLPLLSIVFSIIAMQSAKELAIWSKVLALVIVCAYVVVCSSFFTLVVIGRVYIS